MKQHRGVSSRARRPLQERDAQLVDIDVPLIRDMFLGRVVVCLFGRPVTTSAGDESVRVFELDGENVPLLVVLVYLGVAHLGHHGA